MEFLSSSIPDPEEGSVKIKLDVCVHPQIKNYAKSATTLLKPSSWPIFSHGHLFLQQPLPISARVEKRSSARVEPIYRS
jgi:hypothetical protein